MFRPMKPETAARKAVERARERQAARESLTERLRVKALTDPFFAELLEERLRKLAEEDYAEKLTTEAIAVPSNET